MITIEKIKQVANQGAFFPNWQSLGAFVLPEWFRKAKFGVSSFIGDCTVFQPFTMNGIQEICT